MTARKLLFLLALIANFNTVQAQTGPKSIVSDKVIDSINREFIIHALKVNGQPKNRKAFADSTARNYNYHLFHRLLNEKTAEELPGKAEYMLLINKIDDLKNIPTANLDGIREFYRQNPAFKEGLNRRGNEFEQFFKTADSAYRANLQQSPTDSREKDQPPVIEEQKNFLLGSGFLSGLSLGIGLVTVLWIISGINRKKRKKKYSRKNEGSMNMNSDLNFRIIELERREKALTIQLKKAELDRDDYKRKYEEAAAHLDEQVGLAAEETVESVAPVSQTTQAKPSEGLQYFPSPLSDGSFRKVDGKTSFVETASIYCFRLRSDTEAEFDFCEEPSSVSMALNNRNDLILSVAEEMEGSAVGAKKIITYEGESGRATLEDNKWIVVKKVKIRYI